MMNLDSEGQRLAVSWRHPFRRCVVGCPDRPDPCPVCPSGQECVSRPATCDSCMKNVCVPAIESTVPAPASGPNVGAIAGGVIGGLAILVVIFVVGWYCIKKRKSNEEQLYVDTWSPDLAEKQSTFGSERRGRMSTVGSIASTVLTRASNVIQIAYIPGVTNRSPPDSPSMVPPVPPVPAAQANYDQHYFMPGDIRDSVWSSTSDETRRSIAPSLARSSVATTIYRSHAVVSPVPAQQALRAKAAMVSVKSGNSSSSSNPSTTPTTPAVPAITATHLSKANAIAAKLEQSDKLPLNSSIVARSAVARPINVTKPKQKKPVTDEKKENSASPITPIEDATAGPSADSPTENVPKKPKTLESISSPTMTVIEDSPTDKQGPFADPTSPVIGTSSAIPQEMSAEPKRVSHRQRNSQSSPQAVENLARRPNDPLDNQRKSSPFSDDNEIR